MVTLNVRMVSVFENPNGVMELPIAQMALMRMQYSVLVSSL